MRAIPYVERIYEAAHNEFIQFFSFFVCRLRLVYGTIASSKSKVKTWGTFDTITMVGIVECAWINQVIFIFICAMSPLDNCLQFKRFGCVCRTAHFNNEDGDNEDVSYDHFIFIFFFRSQLFAFGFCFACLSIDKCAAHSHILVWFVSFSFWASLKYMGRYYVMHRYMAYVRDHDHFYIFFEWEPLRTSN